MIPRFIADLGSNHNQNYERLTRLGREAKRIGCSAVKLQMFDERLYRDSNATPKERILSKDFVREFSAFCKYELELPFICTPFNLEAVDFLKEFVNEFKIGSYEILYLDLIKACAKTGLPISISTGGANLREMEAAVTTFRLNYKTSHPIIKRPLPISLYHCSPFYPADKWHACIGDIYLLSSLFKEIPIGYSDHTTHPDVIYTAIIAGATGIEFHLDLDDQKGWESQHGHCWTPIAMEEVILKIKQWAKIMQGAPDENKTRQMRAARTDPTDGSRPLLSKGEI